MPLPRFITPMAAQTATELPEGPDWVKPILVAQVRFVEWTAEGHLRHAAFLALRTDKRAKEVRRE